MQTKPGIHKDVTILLQVGGAWQPQAEDVSPYTVELRRLPSNQLIVDFFTIRVTLFVRFYENHVDYDVRVSNSRASIVGLLGNFDGNGTNEFTFRGSTEEIQYTYPVSDPKLMLDFGTCE